MDIGSDNMAALPLAMPPRDRHRIATAAHNQALERFQTWDERMAMEVRSLKDLVGMRPNAG